MLSAAFLESSKVLAAVAKIIITKLRWNYKCNSKNCMCSRLFIPLADPTRDALLSNADDAKLFVVSIVELTVPVIESM